MNIIMSNKDVNLEGFALVNGKVSNIKPHLGKCYDVIVTRRGKTIITFTSTLKSIGCKIRYGKLLIFRKLIFGSMDDRVNYIPGLSNGLHVDVSRYNVFIREHSDDVPFETTYTV